MSAPQSFIEPLLMPEVTHIATYRNAWGTVTAQRFLFLPNASDDAAKMEANRQRGALDVYCDVFEVQGTRPLGGWRFRQEGGN